MSRRSGIVIELIGDGRQPIFLNLAASIIREIERGRLRSGDRLPGTRVLAQTLKLHRNTVDAAFHELTMQGWLVAEPSRGTFVARDLPELGLDEGWRPQSKIEISPIGRSMAPMTTVSDGTPDPRIMPRTELARAFRRALSTPSFLSGASYGDPRGAIVLREALSGYLLGERGLTVLPDELLITRGSQMGLFLAAAALLRPAEAIAVEEPGYPLAWSAFRAAGAKVIGVPVDDQGINVDSLAMIAEREPGLKAIYVTPHHQYPTTVTLGAGRRLKLLEIARRHHLTIIEDDYDHEYRFDGRPVLPLAARALSDQPVVYVGSMSKLLAPAVRLGYTIARPEILTRMADLREAIDRQGDVPLEHALASLIADGDLRRHARKARNIYAARRNLLAREITDRFGELVKFDMPAGGLALWLRLHGSLSGETWASNAARAGLAISSGVRFVLDTANAPNGLRFGYANLDDDELKRAVTLLASSLPVSGKAHSGAGPASTIA